MSRPLKIGISAGEASGDQQGAALIAAVRELSAPRPVAAWGIGGASLRAAGVDVRHDSGGWGSIGVAETLARVPRALVALASFKRALAKDPPDALVLIDSGAFNVPLARWARERRLCPVLYYFPPGSWRRAARPPARGRRSLAAATDRVVTPFPWSAEQLARAGVDARWVGHPLLDLVAPTLSDDAFYGRFGLDPRRPLVALLPGSRRQEITHILPALIGAAGEISRRIPGVQFALALGSPALRPLVEATVRREQKLGGRAARLHLLMSQAGDRLAQIAQNTLAPPLPRLATNEGLTLPPPVEDDGALRPPAAPGPAPLVICEGVTYDVLARSDLVITKSGTSTLEAAILHKPMIIVYRGSALTTVEWRLRQRSLQVAHIGLPNILAGERLVPELLGPEATPEAISELAVEMLLAPERLLHVKQRLADLVATNLGEPGGVRRAAKLLLDLIAAPRRGETPSPPQ